MLTGNPRKAFSGSYDVILLGTKSANITPGSSSVGIGIQVYPTAPDGIAIGTSAQSQGNGSIGIGSNSHAFIGGSISIGRSTLASGSSNGSVAIGNAAKAREDCISIGHQTGLGLSGVVAVRNILIGTQVGFSISNASSADNVAIGYRSLYSLTTGANNTTLGSLSGDTLTTGSDNTIIGYGTDVDANNRTDTVVIGKSLTSSAENGSIAIGSNDVATNVLRVVSGTLSIGGGKVKFPAATTSSASINIAAGTAPSAPADGDLWVEGSVLKLRLGGTTYNVDITPA